jgi:hypothetical protein
VSVHENLDDSDVPVTDRDVAMIVAAVVDDPIVGVSVADCKLAVLQDNGSG